MYSLSRSGREAKVIDKICPANIPCRITKCSQDYIIIFFFFLESQKIECAIVSEIQLQDCAILIFRSTPTPILCLYDGFQPYAQLGPISIHMAMLFP